MGERFERMRQQMGADAAEAGDARLSGKMRNCVQPSSAAAALKLV